MDSMYGGAIYKMTIKNTKLGGTDWLSNESVYAEDLNDTFNETFRRGGDSALVQSGLNSVRQLIDRDVIVSKGNIEGFGEAYIDADGRKDSVYVDAGYPQSGSTDIPALYNAGTTTYYHGMSNIMTGTTDTDGVVLSDLPNAFDDDFVTYAGWSDTGIGSAYSYVGKVFAERKVEYIKFKFKVVTSYGAKIGIQTYNGSSWTEVYEEIKGGWGSGGGSGTYYYTYKVDDTIQGVRLKIAVNSHSSISQAREVDLYELQEGDIVDSEVVHSIPTDSMPNNMTNSLLVPFYSNYEEGNSVEYKLTNGTSDTGWLDTNKRETFTAFDAQPTQLIVKLKVKDTSPTWGYPSIKGVYVNGYND